MGVGFEDIDIEEHPEAVEIVRKANHGMQSVPTIIFPDDRYWLSRRTPRWSRS
jgi:mycoredoxin